MLVISPPPAAAGSVIAEKAMLTCLRRAVGAAESNFIAGFSADAKFSESSDICLSYTPR